MELSEGNLLFTIKVAKCLEACSYHPGVKSSCCTTRHGNKQLRFVSSTWQWSPNQKIFSLCLHSRARPAQMLPLSQTACRSSASLFFPCALYRIQTCSFWIIVHYCRSKSQLLLKITIKFPLTPAGQIPAMLLYCFLIFNCKTRITTPNSGIFLANVLGFYRISWAKHQHLCWSWDLFCSLQEIICIQLQNLCQERKNSALMETENLINAWRIQKHKNLHEEGPQSRINFCLPYFSLYNKDVWEPEIQQLQ